MVNMKATKTQLTSTTAELRDLKKKFRSFRHKKPNDPLVIEFKKKTKPHELEAIMNQWQEREGVHEMVGKIVAKTEENSNQNKTSNLNYLEVCNKYGLDLYDAKNNEKLDTFVSLGWLKRRPLKGKDKTQVEAVGFPTCACFSYQLTENSTSSIKKHSEQEKLMQDTDLGGMEAGPGQQINDEHNDVDDNCIMKRRPMGR